MRRRREGLAVSIIELVPALILGPDSAFLDVGSGAAEPDCPRVGLCERVGIGLKNRLSARRFKQRRVLVAIH
jgi:hypothetical protein